MKKRIKIHGISPGSSLFCKVCASRVDNGMLHPRPHGRGIRNRRIKPLNLLLLVSLPFLILGVFLTIGSYNRYLAVEAAAEQLEFIKNLPYAINAGESLKMPVYSENLFLEQNRFLSGELSCTYYEGRVSVRRIKASVKHGFFSRTELEYLADARSRN